jgi:PIN domain nuclease of toxin-antitoxin system
VNVLLDTHIWIWSFLEPERIVPRVARVLDDSSSEKWLSPVSVWEFMVLVGKGRVKLTLEPMEWVAKALRDFPIREAPLITDVVLAMPTITLPHKDPADAFLVATAKVFDLTLVTSDSRLLAAKGISLLANR